MTCPCPEHIADRQSGKKHISCPRNGQKLRWAWTEAQAISRDMASLAHHLAPEQCGGDFVIHGQISDMLLKGSSEVKLRFKYLGNVPWVCSTMDTEAGAKEVIRQMTTVALDQHDRLSRDVWRRLEGDIRAVADGGPPSQAVVQEVHLFQLGQFGRERRGRLPPRHEPREDQGAKREDGSSQRRDTQETEPVEVQGLPQTARRDWQTGVPNRVVAVQEALTDVP
jgi:hypothetical protein